MTRKDHGAEPEPGLDGSDLYSSRGFLRFLRHLIRHTGAQDQIEYAVCVGTLALVAAMAIPAIADNISAVLLNTQAVLSGQPASSSGNGNNRGNCGNPTPGNFKGRSPCAP